MRDKEAGVSRPMADDNYCRVGQVFALRPVAGTSQLRAPAKCTIPGRLSSLGTQPPLVSGDTRASRTVGHRNTLVTVREMPPCPPIPVGREANRGGPARRRERTLRYPGRVWRPDSTPSAPSRPQGRHRPTERGPDRRKCRCLAGLPSR